jgi:hypothetical protein
VLNKPEDQKLLHRHLFPKLFELEEKENTDVLTIIGQLLQCHDMEGYYSDILRHYLKKVYNHKREDDIIKQICIITDKGSDFIGDQLVDLIIVLKKIMRDSVEERHQEEKLRACFLIIVSMGENVDEVLHLFFTDIVKLFSNNFMTSERQMSQTKDDISDSVIESYINFILQLCHQCPSVQYYLPSIRQFLTLYFNREISKLKSQTKERKKEVYYVRYEKKLLNRIIDAMIYLMIRYGKTCEYFINVLHTSLKSNNIYHKLYNVCESYFKKHSNLDLIHTTFREEDLRRLSVHERGTSQVLRHDSRITHIFQEGDPKKIIKEFETFVLKPNHTVEQDELWLDNLAYELFHNSNEESLKACS